MQDRWKYEKLISGLAISNDVGSKLESVKNSRFNMMVNNRQVTEEEKNTEVYQTQKKKVIEILEDIYGKLAILQLKVNVNSTSKLCSNISTIIENIEDDNITTYVGNLELCSNIYGEFTLELDQITKNSFHEIEQASKEGRVDLEAVEELAKMPGLTANQRLTIRDIINSTKLDANYQDMQRTIADEKFREAAKDEKVSSRKLQRLLTEVLQNSYHTTDKENRAQSLQKKIQEYNLEEYDEAELERLSSKSEEKQKNNESLSFEEAVRLNQLRALQAEREKEELRTSIMEKYYDRKMSKIESDLHEKEVELDLERQEFERIPTEEKQQRFESMRAQNKLEAELAKLRKKQVKVNGRQAKCATTAYNRKLRRIEAKAKRDARRLEKANERVQNARENAEIIAKGGTPAKNRFLNIFKELSSKADENVDENEKAI